MEQERLVGRGVDRGLDATQRRLLRGGELSDRALRIAQQVAIERQPLDLRERAEHATLHQSSHYRSAYAESAAELRHRRRTTERGQILDHRPPLWRSTGRFELTGELRVRKLDRGAIAAPRSFTARRDGHVPAALEPLERFRNRRARESGGEIAHGR